MTDKKSYTPRELKVAPEFLELVKSHREQDKTVSAIAKELGCGYNKVALADLCLTTPRVTWKTPAELAKKLTADREAGTSWGVLTARYRVTEQTARQAYEAGSGQPYTAHDYRRRSA